MIRQLISSWRSQKIYLKIGLVSLFFISVGLFAQRDLVNIVRYDTISPDCSVILSVKDCSAYSVWDSDYTHHETLLAKNKKINPNPIGYVVEWAYWLWYRLFFAINGPSSQYTNYPPLPLPSIAFVLIAFGGIVAIFKWRRRIFDNKPYVIFLAVITVLYLATLLAEGYLKYRYTGVLELMNGRYLLPVLLLAAAIVGSAFSVALRRAPQLKGIVVIIVALFFLQGGGFFTFIARSDSTWDWHNKAVVKVNDAARRITNPVIVHGKKTYTTSIWLFN